MAAEGARETSAAALPAKRLFVHEMHYKAPLAHGPSGHTTGTRRIPAHYLGRVEELEYQPQN